MIETVYIIRRSIPLSYGFPAGFEPATSRLGSGSNCFTASDVLILPFVTGFVNGGKRCGGGDGGDGGALGQTPFAVMIFHDFA